MTDLTYRSPSTEVRESPIQGRGLFARNAIAKGEIVAVKGGHVLTGAQWRALQPTLGPAEIQIAEDLFIAPVERDERHGCMLYANHSCDPNCGVRLNDEQAFDFVARQPIDAGQELTFDYAMRNFTIDHFPTVCLCGSSRCRGSVTGWKDLPAARKADYGDLVAPYLRAMDADAAC